jgi:hypothetical protein
VGLRQKWLYFSYTLQQLIAFEAVPSPRSLHQPSSRQAQMPG